VEIRLEAVAVSIRPAVLPDVVKPDLDIRRLPAIPEGPVQVLSVPARLRRTGMETKLLIQGALGAEPPRRSDRSLQRLVAPAKHLSDLVMNSNGWPIRDLAVEAGLSPSYFSRMFRLSFLLPEITKANLQGRQPSELSAIKLLSAGRFPSAWLDQRVQFGFD
jgi:lambda repressor-like predicted transcriptional regulator